MAPSSFASAAAGGNQHLSRDGASDWPRRPNGATQTFRRPSQQTPVSSMSPSNAPPDGPPTARYVPPHRNDPTTTDSLRYSRSQLLEIYKAQQMEDGGLTDGLEDIMVSGEGTNGNNSSAGWAAGRQDGGGKAADICWHKPGGVIPLALKSMDDDERELFSTSVNTPLKPPTERKDTQTNGMSGRKGGMSSNQSGYAGPLSPTSVRGPRRRETSDSYPFPGTNTVTSPTSAGFDREAARAPSPPPSLQRRRTDANKPEDRDKLEDKPSSSPFGSLRRSQTAGLGGNGNTNAPSSPWTNAPSSAGFSPMGSFGNFGSGVVQQTTPSGSEKRPGLGAGRAESRFKNLLSKESSEDMVGSSRGAGLEHKTSASSLSKVNENESWRPLQRGERPGDSLHEVDEDDELLSGSAALAAGSDVSPQHPQMGRQQSMNVYDTPSKSTNRDDFGFGAFGMHADTHPQQIGTGGFGNFGRDAFEQTPSVQRQARGNEPMSPTDTNPYQSPDAHTQGINRLMEESESEDAGGMSSSGRLPGLGSMGTDSSQSQQTQQSQMSAFGGLGGGLTGLGKGQGPASDRSQTSSTGPNRGFPNLGGLGGLGPGIPGSSAWPVSQGGLGTPGRQTAGLSNAFGGGIFSNPMGDMQSPGLAGLGSPGGFGGMGGLGGGFPSAGLTGPRGGFGGGFPGMGQQFQQEGRESSPFQGQALAQGQGLQSEDKKPSELQPPSQSSQPFDLQDTAQQSEGGQPPAPQQRTMVMPDRMRWIYRDPQGQTQGPWSGLEMHDWYKAGFFSPELLVKKYEDPDYEPLAQLIRRIGNSREPFLVPQIGIPHGPPGSSSAAWASQGAGPTPNMPSVGAAPAGVAPPFASSFPSFGTTLTAEQQNALERRKQEEQYLMARQKEHLAQAQIAQRMQHQMHSIHPGQQSGLAPAQGFHGNPLHHQSSAQSLHSQPSFGSMTSPGSAFQPSPVQGPAVGGGHTSGFPFGEGGFGRGAPGQGSGGLGAVGAGVDNLGHIREEEIPSIMDRLKSGSSRQFGSAGQQNFAQHQQMQQQRGLSHEQRVQQMLHERELLAQEQAAADAASLASADVENERLHEFQALQADMQQTGHVSDRLRAEEEGDGLEEQLEAGGLTQGSTSSTEEPLRQPTEPLTLTEQVQKAASAKQSPAPQQSVWKQIEAGIPQPFPPAPSQSPLPAPAAQRTSRQSVADHLHAESRSRSQTPSVETPSAAVAPWAKEPSDSIAKGPSLKKIQEAEALQAAQLESKAAEARKAALQREIEAQTAAAAAQQPGLPASSKWAASGGASPATPTGSGPTPWTKAAGPVKTASGTVKTMAQIQKEEEARKKRQAAQAAQTQASVMASVAAPAGGKSYANLAGKVTSTSPAQAPGGGAWTTVGASGKTKTPAPAAPPGVPTRSASQVLTGSGPVVVAAAAAATAAAAPPAATALPTARKPPSRSATMSGIGSSGGINAQEEFKKWAVNELKPDLTKGANAEDIVASLLFLPHESDIITEAVHGVSQTIDSRHFAEEFIRRKKLADKGLVDSAPPKSTASPHANASAGSGGGWSEVAKKGPTKTVGGSAQEDAAAGNGSFRVVPAKKKSGKK